MFGKYLQAVSYTHLRAHETKANLVCRLLLEKKGLTDAFIVDSAGTGSWHIGKKADSRMRIAAERRDINILSRARQITTADFDEFNYILAMDDSNFRNIQDLKNLSLIHI